MYRTLFPSDIFANLDRLQREFQRYSGPASSIRGFGRGGFPALNVGTTPESIVTSTVAGSSPGAKA